MRPEMKYFLKKNGFVFFLLTITLSASIYGLLSDCFGGIAKLAIKLLSGVFGVSLDLLIKLGPIVIAILVIKRFFFKTKK